jgi:hypothetical protein
VVETATAGEKCGLRKNCRLIELGGIAAAVIRLRVVSVPTFFRSSRFSLGGCVDALEAAGFA